MSFDRKLMRNGNGWALCINSTMLDLIGVNPTENMINYTIENNKLIITKSDKNIESKDE